MNLFDLPLAHSVTLEKLRVTTQQIIDRNELSCLDSARLSIGPDDYIVQGLVLRLEAYILGREGNPEVIVTERRRIPRTWWDAVKERWLERWGWTVDRETIEVTRVHRHWKVCPHVRVPEGDGLHVRWMMRDGETGR